MLRSAAQTFVEMTVMIIRVGLVFRVPRELVAVDGLTIPHRRHLVIARPEVEADATTVQVAAENTFGFDRGRNFGGIGRGYHLELAPVNPTHKIRIKRARATMPVG